MTYKLDVLYIQLKNTQNKCHYHYYHISWDNETRTLPGVLHSTDCRVWGLVLVVHEADDVSLACTRCSSSKSPQSSHSFPRSKVTVGICANEAVSQYEPRLVTAVGLSEWAEVVVLVRFRCSSEFWLQTLVPGFIHTEEPAHSGQHYQWFLCYRFFYSVWKKWLCQIRFVS